MASLSTGLNNTSPARSGRGKTKGKIMFKIKINFKYAKVLAEKLKREFGIDFLVIEDGDFIQLVQKEELTEEGVDSINMSINFYKAGVNAVTEEVDLVYGSVRELTKLIEGV